MQLSHSSDLKRLRDEGYEVRVTEAANLVISHVPYLDSAGELAYGRLVSTLNLAGDVASYNNEHTTYFVGGAEFVKAAEASGSYAAAVVASGS